MTDAFRRYCIHYMIWILLNLFYPTKDMIWTVAGHLSRGTCDPVSIIFVFPWTYRYSNCCWTLELLWAFICLLGCSFKGFHSEFCNNKGFFFFFFFFFGVTFWYRLTFDNGVFHLIFFELPKLSYKKVNIFFALIFILFKSISRQCLVCLKG